MQDLTRLSERMARRPAAGSLLLIGRRQMRNHNSWLHNSARLMKGPDRCTLMMHPDDASVRSLRAGQRVAIRSAVGAVTAPLELSDGIMPGVVSLPHGFGHGQPDTRLAVANAHPGASLNDLTDGTALDVLTGTAAFSGTPVVVAAASESDAERPPAPLPF